MTATGDIMVLEFNIGKQFSRDPAGRYYADGDGSGEKFRENYLKPRYEQALSEDSILVIVLDDDVETYGSSFLSEGFGGMVKKGYAQPDDLLKRLDFKYSNPDF